MEFDLPTLHKNITQKRRHTIQEMIHEKLLSWQNKPRPEETESLIRLDEIYENIPCTTYHDVYYAMNDICRCYESDTLKLNWHVEPVHPCDHGDGNVVVTLIHKELPYTETPHKKARAILASSMF